MTGAKYDMSAWRNTTMKRKFKWTNADGSPILLDECKVYMAARRGTDKEPSLKASTEDGKITIVADKGEISLMLTATDLALPPASYKYDMIVVHPNGESRVLVYGALHVYDTVTEV